MSDELAREYADSIIKDINANTEAGHPFGIVSDDTPVTDRENGEDISGMDYLYDALDIQYIVGSDRQYRAGRVCIALGGPTVWVDTNSGTLEVNWWSETVTRDLPAAFIDGLDEAIAELWEILA